MNLFFRLTADTDVAEYVRPTKALYREPCGVLTLAEAVRQSKVQFINQTSLTVGLDDAGGLEFPDMLLYENVPLLSTRFYELLMRLSVDILFHKSVILKDELTGYNEPYTLVVPPSINTVSDAGRYKFFSLSGRGILIVTQELKEAVENANLENVYFEELEDE